MSTLGQEISGRGLDVGLVAQGWLPDAGGVESHTRDLAEELIARGHRVHVLCQDGSDEAREREPYSTRNEQVGGVDVRRVAYRYHDHRALADLAQRVAADELVMAWMADTPCDIVHVHHLTGFGAGTLRVLADMGRPAVMTLHDYWMLCPRGQMMKPDATVCERAEASVCAPCIASTWPHLMPSTGGEPRGPAGERIDVGDLAASDVEVARLRLEHAREVLGLPQRLIVPSRAAREVLVANGVSPERLVVVPNGIEPRAPVGATERAPEGHVHLGVLGAVQPSKGVLELARAVAASAAKDLVLDVHGPLASYHGDDSYVRALRELAQDEPRVQLHGPYAHEDLPSILAGLDGVAAPSLWNEVFGLTVREARAADLPVLLSERGALGEWGASTDLERPEWLLPAGDQEAWIRALESFASDAQVRQRWAIEGPTTCEHRSEMAASLESLYIDAIEEATGRVPELTDRPAPAPPAAPARPGLLRRLFGR